VQSSLSCRFPAAPVFHIHHLIQQTAFRECAFGKKLLERAKVERDERAGAGSAASAASASAASSASLARLNEKRKDVAENDVKVAKAKSAGDAAAAKEQDEAEEENEHRLAKGTYSRLETFCFT
jgi:hypothetical protein